MSKLPQELIVEILLRLPIKPLIQFKCVCKTWHSIISNPEFARLQLRTANNNINCHRLLRSTWPPQSVNYEASSILSSSDGYISNAVTTLGYPEIIRGPDVIYVEILGSCNGMVCLLADNDMFLWNPTTGDHRELPKPNGPLYGAFIHGLGYNLSTDDYGILFASRFTANDAEETIVELHTVKTGIWRRIEDIKLVPQYGGSGIFWNRAIYWLEEKKIGLKYVNTVVAFDMVEEKFKEVLTLPDYDFNPNMLHVSLGMSGSCMCVFVEKEENSFEALVLNINGIEASWTRLFSFPHDRFGGYYNRPLCLTKNGLFVMDSDGWEIYLYNPREGKTKQFKVDKNRESQSELYVESLVSPNN